MPGIGIPELIIVLVILLVIFGPKRLPGLGRSLGSGMREFKDSVTGATKDEDDRPALGSGPAPGSVSATHAATPAATPAETPAAEPRAAEPRV